MSQIADIEDIVRAQPMMVEERAKLFFELCAALGWDTPDGVFDEKDAVVYLFG